MLCASSVRVSRIVALYHSSSRNLRIDYGRGEVRVPQQFVNHFNRAAIIV
jgi:hypothetical protein